MSTPMRHGPSQQGRTPSQQVRTPSQQVRTPSGYNNMATPQASTTFSASQALSPHGPRSSPQQFKKSPAAKNSPATFTATSSTIAGNPAPVNFDSPSAAAALGALGMNDINLDNLSMSGIVGTSGRTDEEDFQKKLEGVIEILWNARSARVSNEGLERVARHLGLECLWEDGMGSSNNTKVLVIAGNTMSVEIGITDHVVHSAALAFATPVEIVDKHVTKASAILKDNLALLPDQSPLTKKLGPFWANLEYLRDLDKLSVSPGLNCYEAIAGVYESLEKLHNWDLEKLRNDPTASHESEGSRRLDALCMRHGLPQVHVRGRIGLSLDYWKDRRNIIGTTAEGEDTKTWSILVGCMATDPEDPQVMINPIRVSDKWIAPSIEKAAFDGDEMGSGPILDWLEPESIMLPPPEDLKAEDSMNPAGLPGPRPPDVAFLAVFDPPVIVTTTVAMKIYNGSPPPASHLNDPKTYDVLLFPLTVGTAYDPSEPRVIQQNQSITVFPKMDAKDYSERDHRTHQNTLHIYKPVYGHLLERMPISHPRELIQILPVLRQYAFVSTLLFNSFKAKQGDSASGEKPEEKTSATTIMEDFNNFMMIDAADHAENNNKEGRRIQDLAVDVTLTTHPEPRLQIVFPFRGATANILLEIQLGGRVHIVSHNIFDDDDGNSNTEGKKDDKYPHMTTSKWASCLETLEDIGYWIEMIRKVLE